MAKASFVAARGFGTEVVILNDLCRDRLGLQCRVRVVPLCKVLSHTPLPAVQTGSVENRDRITAKNIFLYDFGKFFVKSEGLVYTKSVFTMKEMEESEQFALESHLFASICKALAHHVCYTSGSCKSLQLHLVQWDSTASRGVCNRNSGITAFLRCPDPRGKQVCSSLTEMDDRQLCDDMTSRNSLKNPLNKGISFMKAFASPVLHVLIHLPFASYPTLNW